MHNVIVFIILNDLFLLLFIRFRSKTLRALHFCLFTSAMAFTTLSMLRRPNSYTLLGIPRDFTPEQLRSGYKQQVKTRYSDQEFQSHYVEFLKLKTVLENKRENEKIIKLHNYFGLSLFDLAEHKFINSDFGRHDLRQYNKFVVEGFMMFFALTFFTKKLNVDRRKLKIACVAILAPAYISKMVFYKYLWPQHFSKINEMIGRIALFDQMTYSQIFEFL